MKTYARNSFVLLALALIAMPGVGGISHEFCFANHYEFDFR